MLGNVATQPAKKVTQDVAISLLLSVGYSQTKCIFKVLQAAYQEDLVVVFIDLTAIRMQAFDANM